MDQQWTDLQKALTEAYEGFRRVALQLVQQLEDKRGADAQTVKGIIAHLAGWDQEATQRFEAFIGGSKESIDYDDDKFNAASIAARQQLSLDQTLEDLLKTHGNFVQVIEHVTPQQFAMDQRFRQWLQTLINHYVEHTAELEQMLKN